MSAAVQVVYNQESGRLFLTYMTIMVSSEKKTAVNFQCHDAVDLCLSIEREGMVYYEKAAKRAHSQKVKKIFNWLAGEEKEHCQSLRAKAKFLQPALQRKFETNDSFDSFLASEVKGKIFPLGGDDPASPPEPKTDAEALDLGIESERRSIDILLKLLEAEKKMDVRVVFSHLLAEERKHLAALQGLKKELAAEES